MHKFVLANSCPPFYIPIQYRDYQIDANAGGHGSFGAVNCNCFAQTEIHFTRKFDSPDGTSSVMIKRFAHPFVSVERAERVLRELNFLRTIRHENILHMLGSYKVPDDTETIYHITDYCGKRLDIVIEHGKYSMEMAKTWTRELLRALQHLHSNGIIHRSLHPGNICIDANNKLTLIGFGNARIIDREQSMTSDKGTHPYVPIEMLVEWTGTCETKVDIWSVATILCELITGVPLFSSELVKNWVKLMIEYCGPVDEVVLNKFASAIDKDAVTRCSGKCKRGDVIQILSEKMLPGRGIGLSDIIENEDTLRDFVDRTLQYNPENRMSAVDALCHPFLHNLQPWELQLPENEHEALLALEKAIRTEIQAATIDKKHNEF